MSLPPQLASLVNPPADFDARPAVEMLVGLANQAGASDLHLRPTDGAVEVLYRCDGVLRRVYELDRPIYDRLLVGMKNLARLASYKRSVPQDGQLRLPDLEVRVATAPTSFGEKTVIRLIRPGRELPALEALGFTAAELTSLLAVVDQPQGLVLATGPAGSGKTTTMLAAMRWLYGHYGERLGPTPGATLNVVTLEDPIECQVPEFTQTQVQPAAGLTFASGLRSLLRQDPEVILVGEIRDAETAAAAIRASLTGHRVFSSLHTRDSVGVIPRMLEMGVEAYQLSAALTGVVYQRLVRRLCPECRSLAEPEAALAAECRTFGLRAGAAGLPVGCPACADTGYQGRTAVAEILAVDDRLRQGILDRRPLAELRRSTDLVPLRRAALERVLAGVTSYAEVCRAIPGSEGPLPGGENA